MKELDLDAIFAAIRPPLVVHLAVIGKAATACGAPVTGAWGAITSLREHRVTCPDCAALPAA